MSLSVHDHAHTIEVIDNFIQENHVSPTLRELMPIVGIKSTSAMASRLQALEQDGYIGWRLTYAGNRKSSRGLYITAHGYALIGARVLA